jgi:hypothetical protein
LEAEELKAEKRISSTLKAIRSSKLKAQGPMGSLRQLGAEEG